MSVDAKTHRSLAVEANNSTWEILGIPTEERTAEQVEEMTRRAYAAAYHWIRAEGFSPANEARASWLLSRVWVVQGQGELALHHAQRCLTVCDVNDLHDFDRAYAHEALARAHALLGQHDDAARNVAIARDVPIADAEDKSLVDADIASEPWFGFTS